MPDVAHVLPDRVYTLPDPLPGSVLPAHRLGRVERLPDRRRSGVERVRRGRRGHRRRHHRLRRRVPAPCAGAQLSRQSRRRRVRARLQLVVPARRLPRAVRRLRPRHAHDGHDRRRRRARPAARRHRRRPRRPLDLGRVRLLRVHGVLSVQRAVHARPDRRAPVRHPDPSRRPHVVSNSWGYFRRRRPVLRRRGRGLARGRDLPGLLGRQRGPVLPDDLRSPGDYPLAFTVGATDIFDAIAWFSSRGASLLRAAAASPTSSRPGGASARACPAAATSNSGTSMASPHVAGLVALLWSAIRRWCATSPRRPRR